MSRMAVLIRRCVRGAVLAALVGVSLWGATQAEAQGGASITPTFGWQWGGTLEYYDPFYQVGGDVHVEAAQTYGGTISVPVRPGYAAEISYWLQESKVIGRPDRNPEFDLFDMTTHWIQISGIRDLGYGESRVTPYVIGGFGTTVFDPGAPANPQYGSYGINTQWRFSMHAGGGFRVQMNDKISLRLQSRLLLPTRWLSGGVWFGSGGGGMSINGTVVPQGDALVGLQFKLGS